MKTKTVTIDKARRLFVIPEGSGYSCLGFDVCRERASKLSCELGESLPEDYRAKRFDSPLDLYADYRRLVELARQKNAATGWRSQSELTPELIGLENKRVEIVHQWPNSEPETVRFYVGKSTGFIPCHLEIKTRRSLGGGAVCLGEIKSVRVLYQR